MNKTLLESIVGTFLRTVTASIGTWLVARGYITEADFSELIGGIVILLATVGWGIYQKIAANKLVQAALSLPANATIDEAKEKAATESVSTRITGLILIVGLIGIAGAGSSCAKGRSAGDKPAIYSAQSAAALNGVQDVLVVLYDAGKLKDKAIFATHDRVTSGLEVFYARVQAGGYAKGDAIAALNGVINDVERFNDDVALVSDPAVKLKLGQVFFTLKFTLNSIKAIVEAGREPSAADLNSTTAKLRAPVNETWWNSVILVVQDTALRMLAQSRMTVPQAWQDTATIVAEIHETNRAKLMN